jgi:hypothetical protein
MTVTVDFTGLCIDLTFLVYFLGKIVICPDGDSNPRPFGLIFGIKTPNRIQAFTANRTLVLYSIDFWKRTEYVLAVVKLTTWFFECELKHIVRGKLENSIIHTYHSQERKRKFHDLEMQNRWFSSSSIVWCQRS